MSKKRQSKSWYVKVKDSGGNEKEVRVTGTTDPEVAKTLVDLVEGESVIDVRAVRVFKGPSEAAPSNENTAEVTGE